MECNFIITLFSNITLLINPENLFAEKGKLRISFALFRRSGAMQCSAVWLHTMPVVDGPHKISVALLITRTNQTTVLHHFISYV